MAGGAHGGQRGGLAGHQLDLAGGLVEEEGEAAGQVELMTGKPAPLAAMRTAGDSALRT